MTLTTIVLILYIIIFVVSSCLANFFLWNKIYKFHDLVTFYLLKEVCVLIFTLTIVGSTMYYMSSLIKKLKKQVVGLRKAMREIKREKEETENKWMRLVKNVNDHRGSVNISNTAVARDLQAGGDVAGGNIIEEE